MYIDNVFCDIYYLYKDRDEYCWMWSANMEPNFSLYITPRERLPWKIPFENGDIEGLKWK